MSVIVTRQLTKHYGSRVGIQDLNLQVPEGAVLGFLGPNGSGKTTTIRLLLGLLRPTRGDARIFGLDCWRAPHRIKADVGYLPGDLRLYPWMTCRIALDMFGRVRGRDLRRRGGELADQFGLEPNLRVRRMSRGTRQKVGLVLALAHEPRLLVLDEPTSGLDPMMQDKLKQHLQRLASRGHTVFFSSHTLSEVEQVCDRVVILREGALVADETLDAMRARAKREVIIRWRGAAVPADAPPPPFLEVRQRQDLEWHCALNGPVMELVRWSARQPIEDLAIGQPDLESLFQSYYGQGVDVR
jgi:ABC-2 type transport system ATP-binding protein